MEEQSNQDSVRYVIRGKHVGGALPGTRAEMWRDIYVQSGAEVTGGIFGNNLTISGSVQIHGGVHTRGAVHIEGSANREVIDEITFKSVVSSTDSILVDRVPNSRIRFLADIFTNHINIHNSFCRGNIYCKKAIIRDSVILGGVFCTGQLSLQNVILATFRCSKVELKPELFLLYPFAISNEPIKVHFPIRSLSFMNLQEATKSDSLSFPVVELDQNDVIELNEKVGDNSVAINALSLAPRILDLEQVKKHFLKNKEYLEVVALGDHLTPDRQQVENYQNIAELEKLLFGFLTKTHEHKFEQKFKVIDLESREDIGDWMKSVAEIHDEGENE